MKTKKILTLFMAATVAISNSTNTFAMGTNAYNQIATGLMTAPVATIGFPQQLFFFLNSITSLHSFYTTTSTFFKEKYNRICGYLYDGFKTDRDEIDMELDRLFKDVKGQEKAKAKIRGSIDTFLDDLSKNTKNGHIIYIVGPSGVGKSMIAEKISQAILKPYASKITIDPQYVDLHDKDKSVKSQLFSPTNSDQGYGSIGTTPKKIKEKSSLISHLYCHPYTVVIINEYDKLFNSDVDEVLRGILDNGKIFIGIDGEIDCSKVLFIITSNEDLSCVKNKRKSTFSEENSIQTQPSTSPSQEESIESVDQSSESSPTVDKKKSLSDGTTFKNHDPSFLNRLDIVHLTKLNSNNFEEIVQTSINEQIAFFEKEYGIHLFFNSETIKNMALFAQKSTSGARAITNILSNLSNAAIHEKRREYRETGKIFKGKSFEVFYTFNQNAEDDDGNFTIQEQPLEVVVDPGTDEKKDN